MFENFSKWINPEKTEKDWITTVYWLGLFGLLWFYSLNILLSWNIGFASDWSSLLTTGIGAYFIGKTASDAEKEKAMKELDAIKTTLGLRPKVARGLLAISLVLIYAGAIIVEFTQTDVIPLFVDIPNFEGISTLFWAVIGFYLPYFVIKKEKTS